MMPSPWKKHFRQRHVPLDDDDEDYEEVAGVTSACTEDWLATGNRNRNHDDSSSSSSSSSDETEEARRQPMPCNFLPDDANHQPEISVRRKTPDDQVVATTAIYDSEDEEVIELEQVFEEFDTDDASTIQTNPGSDPSISGCLDGGFEVRVAKRLVHLQQISATDEKAAMIEIGSKRNSHEPRFKCSRIRLSVASVKKDDSAPPREPRLLASPRDLLDVEKGTVTIICKKSKKPLLSWNAKQPGDIKRESSVPAIEVSSEVGEVGGAWRGVLRRLIEFTLDEVNALRLSRFLQFSLPFLTGFESYLTAQVIEALDSRQNVAFVLHKAFQNRNVSRLIVQAVGPRHDFIYHWGTAITWNRSFDLLGQFPIIGGLTRFPATENFPSTRNHALASIFRVVLGKGNWLTRVVTGGREGLITDDPDNTAQNLAAESNGFEQANRSQYGTYFGRVQTNQFRFSHRLPTDESLVRTFIAQPISTMTNNGMVHCLRQLAKHWHNMLTQPWGNFAHQRMEQLDPFETLRFHMPEVLLTLSSLRGRNEFDAKVLGPMVRLLQSLSPSATVNRAFVLVQTLKRDIVVPVCGGIPNVVEPFMSWLEAIRVSLGRIQQEAKAVFELVSPVELGIRLGHDVMSQVNWQVPSDAELKGAIIRHILGESAFGELNGSAISRALESTTPRDKRTLVELIQQNLARTKPAKLLLARVKTLLHRELRRDAMNAAIRELSKGDYTVTSLVTSDWYWLEDNDGDDLYIYSGKSSSGQRHQFVHVNSGSIRLVSNKRDGQVRVKPYVPVAEAITRAQKVFMTIELNHGKVFSYNAFMEFTPLRVALRRLIVVSQMACEVLDNARLNVLSEIQLTGQKMKTNPQNMVVIGGGPTGMMTCIHCCSACLESGGVMKIYEARDTFAKGGSTYERAQIVRLDARWIAMLRYHLGTGFEDVFIPASGETDSQLGNTLPTQGFVEITIKDLENMLHVEISRLWSRNLIAVFTDSKSQFNPETNSLTKLGEKLKIGDVILRKLDCEGRLSKEYHGWKVVELVYTKSLAIDEIKVGEEYRVYYRPEQVVLPFLLIDVDLDTKSYNFKSLSPGIEDLHVSILDLPSIYPAKTEGKAHADVHKVVLESVATNSTKYHTRLELLMENIRKETFTLDVGNTHVIEAIGKSSDSKVHFRVTTPEPYGVCCLEGLKVSMGMHNFGEKRWGSGIVDDIRSLNDQNTRIIGDFTKMVRTSQIVEAMSNIMSTDKDWAMHFKTVIVDSNFPTITDVEVESVLPLIIGACNWLSANSKKFRRPTLQTRFFESGDNYYLGMELPREYTFWKRNLTDQIVAALDVTKQDDAKHSLLLDSLMHSIDRLWYFACLETIRTGDVYNPGARRRVPRLYTINSSTPVTLGSLADGESFRLLDSPQEKYEILLANLSTSIVRNVEGYVFQMSKATRVKRESNLTRSPDGNEESRVALSSFPVSHYVNYRTMRLSNADKGYVFAFTGDEQATPHFMRYSGLTGACINAMSFNIFIQNATEGIPFVDRFRAYSQETNWSNGEVVMRGTLSNYGDGFLRPGFPYSECIDYLSSKFYEFRESHQDLNNVLSRDWKVKIAASLIPRGMELNHSFTSALCARWQDAVYKKFVEQVRKDVRFPGAKLDGEFDTRKEEMRHENPCTENYWLDLVRGLRINSTAKETLDGEQVALAAWLNWVCREIIAFAEKENIYNERVSSELINQPKPVDSVVDDFAVEAQTFANSLTLAAAFGAGTLAFRLVDRELADTFSAILGALNILIAFGTMTNCSRYKIRNEEARNDYMDTKLSMLKKAVFALINPATQAAIPQSSDPFLLSLEKAGGRFRSLALYYDHGEPHEFNEAFAALKRDVHNAGILRSFQQFLTQKLMADVYQTNSYVQESLVDVYRLTEEAISAQNYYKHGDNARAAELFERLQKFEPRLEESLQRGPVRWGFLKVRKFWHWDIIVIVRYFYNKLCCCQCPDCRFASIQTEIMALLRQTRRLSSSHGKQILSRQIRDIETLYWATRESDIASSIFVVASLTFTASIVFTIAQIFAISVLTDLAFFAAAASALGALLAVHHFVRKFFILAKLWIVLWSKARIVPSHQMADLRLVRGVTFTQLMLTLTRFCAATAAAVALPFSVAETGFGMRINTPADLPFWIALGAISAAIGSTIFFFVVEYVIRYKLPTELGPFVCGLFQREINELYRELSEVPKNSVDTKIVQEREAWEYTARAFLHQWRFDTVFAADRFGQILQFIQSGAMKDL